MFLVQLILPVEDNDGREYPRVVLDEIAQRLAQKFGGVTAYSRAPARGEWVDEGRLEKDDVIIVEVMAKHLEREWWTSFRKSLEASLGQQEIVIRAHAIERL